MQTQQNKASPLSNIVKSEATLSLCAVKQEDVSSEGTCQLGSPTFDFPVKRPLIDNAGPAMTTPHTKRIKQERDWEPSFSENKEGISSSITSLQSIVNEVARSFENDNNYENILSSQRTDNSGFYSTNDTPLSVQKDAIVIERKERQLNSSPQFAADANEVKTGGHENIEALARFVDSHKEKRTVLGSFADQVQAQTTRPILRTLKSLQSGTSEGFAFDHNFFPKLVGVHSISSPTSNSSTEVESHLDFQQINRSSPASAPLEKLGQDQNISDSMEEAVDVYEIDATASSPTNQITRNSPVIHSPTNFQSQKQYDLLFTFTKEDVQGDMFLVIKDEVFAVRRFDYKGESYLIHTDNQGKTSVLAKAPSEEDSGSQDNGGSTCAASGQKVSNTRGETTNVLSTTSEQSRHASYQGGASHAQYQTEPHISSTPLHVNARENAPTTYDQRQTAYGGMRMPRRQLSNQTNAGPRAESSRYIPQRPQFTSWPQRAPAGQQRFPSQARANRHQLQDIANDPTAQLQNSTAVPINVRHNVHSPPRAPNSLSRSWSNQQLIVNQDLAARNQTNNDAMNIHSQQRYTNTAVQGIYNEHNTVSSDRQRYLNKETIDVDRRRGLAESSSVSAATHENRIAQRSELMKYIANQLASREGPAPSATNSSDFMNSASRRHEAGRPGQAYNENAAANEWLNRTASTSRCQEMAGRRQRQDTGAYTEGQCTSSRNVFSVGNNLGARDVGQRYHSNQRVRQDNVHSQPRYDAMHRNVNPLQGGLQSNGETERNDTVLQIIELWKRRQQKIPANNVSQQLRQLLARAGPSQSSNSAQNTGGVESLPRETSQQLRRLLARADPSSSNSGQNTGGVESQPRSQGLSSSRQKETLGTRLVESSPRETTMRRNSPVQASPTVASATPVISQISYGVIRRSTHGENVSPKRTATALVIDQQRSIYVDATDSVIDEERSPGTTGQQFSNGGNKFPHTNQPGSVAVSCPVSSGAAVRGWLQETERPVNSNLTSGQQQHIQCSSVSQQSPSTFSAGYLSLANQTSQPRLYSTEMPPRKTAPKIDKRCVANNTLPVYTNHLPLKRSSVPTFISGQQSCIVEAPVRSIAEIAKPCEVAKPREVPKPCVVAKPCEVATSHGLARPCEVSKPYEVARLCEAAKPCEVAKPQVATKLCDDNTETDDIVEIIDPPPKRSSIPNTTRDSEKKDKDMPLISGQQSCIDETCAPAAKSTAELSKTYHADRPDKTDESDDVVEITNPSLKRDSVDHENVEKEDNLSSKVEDETEIRNNALRAELVKKIQNTRERIEQETIDWKKKYLHRLKVVLMKKLAKIPGVIDVTVIDDD